MKKYLLSFAVLLRNKIILLQLSENQLFILLIFLFAENLPFYKPIRFTFP